MSREQAATLARVLLESWQPAGDIPFPTQQEHEEVCARLGLDPTLGQEPAVLGHESERAHDATPPDREVGVGRG